MAPPATVWHIMGTMCAPCGLRVALSVWHCNCMWRPWGLRVVPPSDCQPHLSPPVDCCSCLVFLLTYPLADDHDRSSVDLSSASSSSRTESELESPSSIRWRSGHLASTEPGHRLRQLPSSPTASAAAAASPNHERVPREYEGVRRCKWKFPLNVLG